MHLKFSFQLKFQHSFPSKIYRSSGLVVLLNIPLAISPAESLHNNPYSNCDQMMIFAHLYYTWKIHLYWVAMSQDNDDAVEIKLRTALQWTCCWLWRSSLKLNQIHSWSYCKLKGKFSFGCSQFNLVQEEYISRHRLYYKFSLLPLYSHVNHFVLWLK